MMKNLLTLLCGTILTSGLFAQITPEYTSPNGTSNNVFPFNSTTNQVQWVYLQSDFTPAVTPGLITKVYFYVHPTLGSSNTANFTNLTVKMSNTTLAATVAGPWNTGLTTVYQAPTTSMLATQSTWTELTLQTPFFYTGGNLLMEVSQSSYSPGFYIVNYTAPRNARMWGSVGSTTASAGDGLMYFGFDMVKENDLTPTKLVSPNLEDICSGFNDLKVRVKNMGIIDVTPFKVNWSVDNVLQSPVIVTNTLQSYGNIDSLDIDFGNINLVLNTPVNLKIWTSDPNNTVDPNPANDTLSVRLVATRQGITLSPLPDTSMCKGDQLIIDAGYNVNTDYTWSNGNQTQQGIFNSFGPKWLFAYNTDGCMHRDTFMITEIPAPTAAPIIAAIDMGAGQFIYDIANAQNIDFYEWNFGDGSPLEYGAGPKPHTYAMSGIYNVTLRLGNQCDTLFRNLDVVYEKTDLSTHQLGFDQKIDLYPVPFDRSFTVKAKQNAKVQHVIVYNAIGQVIYDQTFDQQVAQIDLKEQAVGQYVVSVKINGEYYYKTIVNK